MRSLVWGKNDGGSAMGAQGGRGRAGQVGEGASRGSHTHLRLREGLAQHRRAAHEGLVSLQEEQLQQLLLKGMAGEQGRETKARQAALGGTVVKGEIGVY